MSDVLIGSVSKLKQGDLLRVCRERGWTQSEMGARLGLTPTQIGDFINMKRAPVLTEEAERLLVEWTGKLPEDLVPVWLSTGLDALSGREIVRYAEVSRLQLEGKVSSLLLESHEGRIVEEDSLKTMFRQALHRLSPRQEAVVRGLFGIDRAEVTQAQMAAEMGLSRQHIHLYYKNALKKLRALVPEDGPRLSSDKNYKRWRQSPEREKKQKLLAAHVKHVLSPYMK